MRSLHNFAVSRNRSFFGARCLVVFLLIGALVIPIASNTGSAQSPDSGPKSKADELRERARAARLASLEADADKPHSLAASYFSLQGNLKATLMLNNKGPKPLDVQPTLFNLFGDRLDVPAVTVGANTFREIDLSEWASRGGGMFGEGSLQLFYKGPDLLMGAQVRMVDPGFSLMFDEQLVEPAAKYSSSRLEGVWLLPSRHCQLRVVLTNTTDDPLSLSVTVGGAGAKQREAVTLTLRPRETRVMDVRQDLMEKQAGGLPEAGGISIHHSGAAGALLARGMISETAMGYSSAVEFVDPEMGRSTKLHGAGLRLGRAGSEQLIPEVVARNIGDVETLLRGRIPYTTSDGGAGEIAISEVRLRPGEVRRLYLSRAANPAGRGEIASAGLELEYDGKPGSVIVSAQSASRSRDHVYRVPMLDPAGQQSSTGGYRKISRRSSGPKSKVRE